MQIMDYGHCSHRSSPKAYVFVIETPNHFFDDSIQVLAFPQSESNILAIVVSRSSHVVEEQILVLRKEFQKTESFESVAVEGVVVDEERLVGILVLNLENRARERTY